MSLLDETSPIFDESKSQVAKKEKYGFAALMVLMLCLTSFMAGQASSRWSSRWGIPHASTASAIRSSSGVQWSKPESCWRWITDLRRYCNVETYECFSKAGYNGDYSGCAVPELDIPYNSCPWAMDVTKQSCTE